MQTNANKVAREIKCIYKDADVRSKNIKSVCSEGCSHCCHQHVRIHWAEGALIDKFIEETMSAEIKENVLSNFNSWFEFFNDNTPNGGVIDESEILNFEKIAAQSKLACPFLIEDRCSIYAVRPLVCRTHSVNDTPDLCKENSHRNGNPKGYEIQNITFKQISRVSDSASIRSLMYATCEKIGYKKQLKPVLQMVTPTLKPNLA